MFGFLVHFYENWSFCWSISLWALIHQSYQECRTGGSFLLWFNILENYLAKALIRRFDFWPVKPQPLFEQYLAVCRAYSGTVQGSRLSQLEDFRRKCQMVEEFKVRWICQKFPTVCKLIPRPCLSSDALNP